MILPISCIRSKIQHAGFLIRFWQKWKVRYCIGWFVLVFTSTISLKGAELGFLSSELPEDERTAVIDLEEGFFDSVSWDMLKTFYSQPLSVPLGELRYLQDIFPELPEDLPTQPEILACYEPWTSENIAVFFKDYPYLVPFRALLSFETEKVPSIAHFSFFSRLSGFSETFRQSVKFMVTPSKYMRADGTVYFEENFARWQRRRILLTLPNVGRVQIGNFSFTMNRGLFYGYFPRSTESRDTVKYNWLYGESRTWNGFSTKTPIGKKNVVHTLFHTRKTESIIGLKTEHHPTSFLSLYGGLSGALSNVDTITDDTSFTVHGGVTVSMGIFSIELASGTNLLNARNIPVYLTLSHGKKQKHSISFIRIPVNFFAPRSSLLHSFYSRLETNDSSANDITGVGITFANSFAEFYRQTFYASYITMKNNADLKTSYQFSSSQPFDYAFYYRLNVSNFSNILKQRFKVSCNYITGSIFGISSIVSYDIKSDAYWRIMAHLQTDFKLFSGIHISPFITYISGSKVQHDLAVGFKQRIDLFKKTFGEVKLTIPVLSHYNEKYSFYAKANFLF